MSLPLDINFTRHGFFVVDMDTGKDLLCFERRYKRKTIVLCQYRDPVTKRYGKLVREFYLQYVGVFEVCYEGQREGKGSSKANDLHVECHEYEAFYPRDYNNISDLLDDLENSSLSLQSDCGYCFSKFRKEPQNEHICFRTIRANSECYYDRCEEEGEEIESLCKK